MSGYSGRLLRPGRCARGVPQRANDRSESRENDEHTHSTAVRILLPALLLTEESHFRLQVRELGRSAARGPNRQHALYHSNDGGRFV